MSDNWKRLYKPSFACIILIGILLVALPSFSPLMLRDYNTERELRAIQGSLMTLQLISYGFGVILTAGNALFFWFRSKSINAPPGKQGHRPLYRFFPSS
jgi:hypothetical protein